MYEESAPAESASALIDARIRELIGSCQPRHRSREFVNFLNHLEKQLPLDQEVHLIMDNYRTHKSAEAQRRRKPTKRKRFHFHFTPTSSSWLNQVERFFALITGKMVRRCRE